MSTVSRVFSSPAKDVWKVIADGWLYSGWVVGATRIRAVDAHWPEAGSRLHHSVGVWPLVIDDTSRVSASLLRIWARNAVSPSQRTPSADPANWSPRCCATP